MTDRGGRGYTLFEVLIFIALTSVLLFIAIAVISGNQRATEFSQSVRDLESRINDAINDVPTGYFLTNDALNCDASGSGRPVIDASGGAGLGADEDCIYVGKALQFSPDGDNERILVYSLAGRRFGTITGGPAQTIDDAAPVAIARPGDASFPDVVEDISLQFGVRVHKVFSASTSATPYGTVGILTAFEGSSPIAGVASDAQAVQIGGVVGSALGNLQSEAVALLNSLKSSPPTSDSGYFDTSTEGVVVCLTDNSDRRASLTLGTAGGSGVLLDIDTYDTRCFP